MKYKTKKWYKNVTKYHFPMNLEIINSSKKDIQQIFEDEYKNEFNKMKNKLPKNYEEEVFNNIFNSYLENCKKFFYNETLKNIVDIRLLALGKVFKEEYDFIEKDAMQAYNKIYNTIKKKLPKDIEERLHLHDCLITNIVKEKERLIIELNCEQGFGDVKRIIFDKYTVLEEEMNFINGWWLYEEIYIVDNNYELHILIDVPYKNSSNLGYFTIRASNITLNTN